MRVFDNDGNLLGALPADAQRIDATHYVSAQPELTGKYIDSDGIVYEPDGTVNEALTALAAREAAMRASTYGYDVPDPTAVKADTIRQMSEAEGTRMYVTSMLDNFDTTAQDIAQRAVNVGGNVFTALKWIVGAVVVIEVLRLMPHDTRRAMGDYARRQTGRARKRVRKYVKRQLAGA